jgi:hypothetical protein
VSNQAAPLLRVRRALTLGFSQGISLWPSTLLLFSARAMDAVAGLAFGVALFHWLDGRGSAFPWALLGGWFTCLIVSQALRAFVVGGALGQGAQRLRGEPFRSARFEDAVVAGAAAAPVSFAYLWTSLVFELLVAAWRTLALLAAGWVYFQALIKGSGGLVGSAALALAILVSLPLSFLASLWTEVAFARAVSLGRKYLAALFDAASALASRFWAFLSISLITGLLAFLLNLSISSFFSWPSLLRPFDPKLSLVQQGSIGLLMAFALAVLEMSRLQAFAAMALDSVRELPPEPSPPPAPLPPVAEVVLPAEVIVPALPVDPS